MPKIEQDFNENILELIGDGTVINNFMPNQNHFIRMSVYDEDNNLVKEYNSNLTFDNELVYWASVGGDWIPFTDENTTQRYYYLDDMECTAAENLSFCDKLQLPLHYDSGGKVYVKPNDIFQKDVDINYESGKYTLKFDFLDDIFNYINSFNY